jgi:spore germination protein GerM
MKARISAMSQEKPYLLIGIGIILLLLLASCTDNPITPPQTDNNETEDTQEMQVNFSRTGNLMINNPGLDKDTWYLSYETAGKPANQTKLNFDEKTVCLTESGSQNCLNLDLNAGDRVSIEGAEKNGSVTISKLVLLSRASNDTTTPPTTVKPPETTTPPKNETQMQTVKLYYYNLEKDKQIGGDNNPACSADAVLPVTRQIPITQSPIKDTIELLIKGQITSAEKAQGFQTEFPNSAFKLLGANLKNGTLTLEFTEVPGFTDGGSCRTGVLWSQIQKTALQFNGVNKVEYTPEILFQP